MASTTTYTHGIMEQNATTPEPQTIDWRDPVIEAYKKDIDRTMLRENLKRTVQERVDAFLAFMKAREEFQRAGEAARERR